MTFFIPLVRDLTRQYPATSNNIANGLNLNKSWTLSPLTYIGMGLHHSGVEILGREYSFASGGGIFDSSPKEAPGAIFRESIEMGSFDGGSSELQSAISGG